MNYTVNDNTHAIKIRLVTNVATPSKLKLKVFKSTNSSSTNADKVYTPIITTLEDDSSECLFIVKDKDFTIGDVLNRFIMTYEDSTLDIEDTNEGLTVLLDGEYFSTIHSDTFTTKFNKGGEHTIQIVYKGNELVNMASTTLERFNVLQPVDGQASSSGVYKLEFVNKKLSTMTYNDLTVIAFRLTKGGSPQVGKTVEMVAPYGEPITSVTDTRGIVSFTNNTRWNAGKYRIGAYFYDYSDNQDNKVIDSVYKNITIEKAHLQCVHTSNPVGTGSSYQKKKRVEMHFTDRHGNDFKNKKMSIYINGQLKTIKTSSTGRIILYLKQGTHKIRATYNGDTNYEKSSVTFTEVVPKNWGGA